MTRADRDRVRTAIMYLEGQGRDTLAAAVWDLLDAYISVESELDARAENSPAVTEVETLLRAADLGAGHIAGDKAARCPSTYVSTENAEFVQCQRFTAHDGPHTYDRLGSTTGEYAWSDSEEVTYGAPEPVLAPRVSPEVADMISGEDVAVCRARYAGHPKRGNLVCDEPRDHSGDHRDLGRGAAWSNLDDTIREARHAAALDA